MTRLSDLMSPDLLEQMVAQGYVRVREHPVEAGLKLYNYSEACQYEKVWNEVTLQCRGLIVDADNNIVARPYRKFWNRDEVPDLIKGDELVQIVDKMDGSLGIAYYYVDPAGQGEDLVFAIATRGSFDSDQARWATAWMRNTYPEWLPTARITPLFEILYPENRIVVDYGDRAELVMLGGVHLDSGEIYGPLECKTMLAWPGRVAETLPQCTIFQYLRSNNASRPNREGVVVRTGQRMVKIKQEDYVELHRLVTGLTNRTVWEALAAGKPENLHALPDEFFAWAQSVRAELEAEFTQLKNAAEVQFGMILSQLPELVSRKTFAMKAKDHPYSAALFRLWDGKDISDWVWARIKPETITRPYGGMSDDA